MASPDVTQRHRWLMTALVTRWRRWADLGARESDLPYDDDDEMPDDREKVVAEVLGRFLGSLGKLPLDSCGTAADVDRTFAKVIQDAVADDTRPGAVQAAQIVRSLLQVPVSIPKPDSPSLDTGGA